MIARLLIIDPQNDFCDVPGAALPVAGADADMHRLADFMQDHGERLASITVTLDSHASVAVERTTFWKKKDGGEVAPFTEVTAAQVRAGEYMPRDAALAGDVLAMLDKLEAGGRYRLMVWPVHCVTGTWGHNIHDAVAARLASWKVERQRPAKKVLKGVYTLSEHYGVFEAEVPVDSEENTRFNHKLAHDLLAGTDLLLVAGEASSHCVAASVEQLLRFTPRFAGKLPAIALIRECMSPVSGFEAAEQAFFDRVAARGVERIGLDEAARRLRS
ncbi:cysteine hydrolase family protein [Noviherbaspirillum galbum]|uniref:Isochorismatase family protein n=1 Tax=Noviherbaspirillum galbum TaxID=2709383 RepID=A0A6B3SMC5_9BURK|nr:isochorismatase family protein [Noviherbaspirillum galbum]NEX61931.1 isochorismatase family protein [Noviherbaspirillum galbum]